MKKAQDLLFHRMLYCVITALVIFLIICAVPKHPHGRHHKVQEATASAKQTDVGPFLITLADGWAEYPSMAAGSPEGEFRKGSTVLRYHYGKASDPLPDENDPAYEAIYEPIGGRAAKIIWPRDGYQGVVGVYFPKTQNDQLTIVGAVPQNEWAEVTNMYRSIRFK